MLTELNSGEKRAPRSQKRTFGLASMSLIILSVALFVQMGTPGRGSVEATTQILRLDEEQMNEILRYIHAEAEQQKGKEERDAEEDTEIVPIPAREEREEDGGGSRKKDDISPRDNNNNGQQGSATDGQTDDDDNDPSKWQPMDLSSPNYLLENNNKPPQQNQHQEEEEQECKIDMERRRTLQKSLRDFLHSQLQHIWTDQFAVQVLGLNVSIHSIRARQIVSPPAHIQTVCSPPPNGPAQLVVSLSGGSLSLHADYRSVYRTVRTGQLRVHIGQLKAKIGDKQKCDPTVQRLKIRFRPKLLEEVDQEVEAHIRDRIRHLFCNRLPAFLNNERLMS